MKYEFNCKITEKDYLELNEFNILHTKELRKAYNREHFLIPVLTVVLCIGVLYLGYGSATAVFGAAVYCLIGILWIAFYKKLFKNKLKRQLKLAKKAGKSLFVPENTAQFYDDRIIKDSGVQRFEIGYDAVKRLVVLGNRMIYMFTDTQNTVVVPQNVFESEEQKNEFIGFLESKTVKAEAFDKI